VAIVHAALVSRGTIGSKRGLALIANARLAQPGQGEIMPGHVVIIVLCGAFLHASWNAVVKSGDSKFHSVVMVVAISGVMAAVVLPFLAQPSPESWPYLALSAALQSVYIALIARSYSHIDMSLAYPLMRGSAPLLVALASGPLIGETLPALRWLGVILVSSGVLAMALDGLRLTETRGVKHGILAALLNAGFIAAYTITDGIGVRKSGAPIAYTLWIFVLHAVPLVLWILVKSRARLVELFSKQWKRGIFGAIATLGSYGAALWAMSLDVPIASVAALRETSILFAAGLSVFIFGEKIGPWRWLGVALICAGVATIRFA
jgi:drug/metabolite transporter (DMT)-like permease